MKYLLSLLLLISVSATAQYSPTAAKTRFVNGIGFGTKDTTGWTGADTVVMIIGRDSTPYIRYKGYWKPLAYAPTTGIGTVKSVGLSMPSAFSVANSPITTTGTLAVTGAGNATQYVRGDGTLAVLPTSGGGGGSSVNYYLNGSTAASVSTYYQMSNTAVIGTGTDFTLNADGVIAQFLTDAGNPNALTIPAGNWNFELYFSASSAGGTPTYYVDLYKYSVGGTFTLIATNVSVPKPITSGTLTDLYISSLAVPTTTLLTTDRLAVRVHVIHSSRTITLHTEDSHLCEVITTFSSGISALNGLTAGTQYFATGTSGTDFGISSATDTHTFNLPTASATNRGLLSSANWATFNSKIGAGDTATMLSPYARKYAYVPYTGATTNVNLGSNTFTSGTITSNGNINNNLFNLSIRNTNSGTSAATNLELGNDVTVNAGGLALFSSAYITGSGPSNQYKADGFYIYSNRVGGLTMNAEYATSNIYLATNNTLALKIDSIQRVLISNSITAGSFIKTGSSDSYFLLGGGGTVATSSFAPSVSGGYVPYTGATGAVNLGAYGITAASATLNSANITASNGIALSVTNNSTTFQTIYALNSGSGNIATFSNSGGTVATIGNGGTTLNGLLSSLNTGGGNVGAVIGNSSALSYGVKIRGASDATTYALTVNSADDGTIFFKVLGNGVVNSYSRLNVNGATDNSNLQLNVTGNIATSGSIAIGGTTIAQTANIYGTYASESLNSTSGNFGYLTLLNGATGGGFNIAVEGSSGGTFGTGTTAYSGVLSRLGAYALHFVTDGTIRQTISATGIASFSSRLNVNGATDDGSTALNVTGAGKFTGLITSTVGNNSSIIYNASATTGYVVGLDILNTSGRTQIIQESSVAGTTVTGSTAYASLFGSARNSLDLQLFTNATVRMTLNGSTGAATFSSLAGTGSRIVVADASGTLSATTAASTSGTYTPTITLVTNAASSTARVCQYMRVGSVVTVSGYVTVTATTPAASSRIYMSLPISSSFTSTAQAGGAGGVPGGANIGTVIFANSTATTVSMDFLPVSGATDYWFTYTYQIL